jgi:membrane protease YdiL (CAAX protease family)
VPPLSLIIATIVGLAVIGWNNTWLLDWLRPANLITPETLRAGIQFAIIAPWLLGLHGLLSLWIPYSHDTLEQIKASPPFAKLIWSWVSAVIAAPLSEEFVFRGLLLHWLVTAYPEHLFPGGKWSAQGWGRFLFGTWWGGPVESRPSDHSDGNSSTSSVIPLGNSMPVWIAILASSALFAGMHQNQGAAPVTLFLMATFWGWITAQSRSLWPAVLTHMGLNAWTMALTTWGQ